VKNQDNKSDKGKSAVPPLPKREPGKRLDEVQTRYPKEPKK
jgi:hypothetical protein